jgi:uncharacterized protein YutD
MKKENAIFTGWTQDFYKNHKSEYEADRKQSGRDDFINEYCTDTK